MNNHMTLAPVQLSQGSQGKDKYLLYREGGEGRGNRINCVLKQSS